MAKAAQDQKPKDERFLNFRVSRGDFIAIKTAALQEDLTLGQYMVKAHQAYQASKKG